MNKLKFSPTARELSFFSSFQGNEEKENFIFIITHNNTHWMKFICPRESGLTANGFHFIHKENIFLFSAFVLQFQKFFFKFPTVTHSFRSVWTAPKNVQYICCLEHLWTKKKTESFCLLPLCLTHLYLQSNNQVNKKWKQMFINK